MWQIWNEDNFCVYPTWLKRAWSGLISTQSSETIHDFRHHFIDIDKRAKEVKDVQKQSENLKKIGRKRRNKRVPIDSHKRNAVCRSENASFYQHFVPLWNCPLWSALLSTIVASRAERRQGGTRKASGAGPSWESINVAGTSDSKSYGLHTGSGQLPY